MIRLVPSPVRLEAPAGDGPDRATLSLALRLAAHPRRPPPVRLSVPGCASLTRSRPACRAADGHSSFEFTVLRASGRRKRHLPRCVLLALRLDVRVDHLIHRALPPWRPRLRRLARHRLAGSLCLRASALMCRSPLLAASARLAWLGAADRAVDAQRALPTHLVRQYRPNRATPQRFLWSRSSSRPPASGPHKNDVAETASRCGIIRIRPHEKRLQSGRIAASAEFSSPRSRKWR